MDLHIPPESVLIEAETFSQKGGWVIDSQFTHSMGSAYLMAHGLGSPVEDATTHITITSPGAYSVWVRSTDWCAGPWDPPGRFQLAINEHLLPATFGTRKGWGWENGGKIRIESTELELKLHDLTGFNGRCDAIFITSDQNYTPPDDPEVLDPWREQLLSGSVKHSTESRFDVVITGGGLAGCAAALAAANRGMQVALVHDRPILGGNASGEVRVHSEGIFGKSKSILSKIATKHWANGSPKAREDDRNRHSVMETNVNIQLYLSYKVVAGKVHEGKITSVDAFNYATLDKITFSAPVFIDCTGDGGLGALCGARDRYGREAFSEFGERWEEYNDLWSPEIGDSITMGASLLWNTQLTGSRVPYPKVPWARPVAKNNVAKRGTWHWEYADDLHHQVFDAEFIRDHLLRAIYGSFSNAKSRPGNRNLHLVWAGYILGKRESRRLMGDYIYSMGDMVSSRQFPDTVAEETRNIDVHYQRHKVNRKRILRERRANPPDFLSTAIFRKVDRYHIPFRTLYSVNISNLLMAGRCFSCTHIGLGGPRVMNTLGQMGVAVGYASALCKKYSTTPRGVYQDHLAELRELIGYS